ncbi:hypothetical protein N7468_004190 [Penicillium chermesinum]|uniref:Uncharacterized protein n=1 Tax=Penicillium chermesinum TaxID=63820 RepID=A0A9W9TSC3_9EURO|nr:uncharacterized protein N7468_004190 [Penicillium chermesinum]KAJ5239571.1 hypothetical protein N7468_004190 [Penicillium chermesinum]KAJ6166465.1 hypothetical protein N7470_001912 [Penicillium chermesinum]
MANIDPPDYKASFLKEQERRKQAEDDARREKQIREELQELSRPTTFAEFLRHCHNLLSRPLSIETPSRSRHAANEPSVRFRPRHLPNVWLDKERQAMIGAR